MCAQGGMEIPADFFFKTVDAKLHNQREREKVLKELENFEQRRKIGINKSLKKERQKKKIKSTKKCVFNLSTPNLIRFDTFFTLIISTTINFKFQGILFPLLLVRPLQNNYFFRRIKLEE